MILDPATGRFNAGEAADGRFRHMAWRSEAVITALSAVTGDSGPGA
jgi:hypothetical protein